MNKRTKCALPEFLDITVMGERGQVVIPKKIRDTLKLKPGTRLLVMLHANDAIVMSPAENMKSLMEEMQKRFAEVGKLIG
jgi:AbrB family looped-hinge helix DNA binding protein